ncbi:MAG: FlgD immunoglobulin-like domain containing protein, partial [bacterium]
EYALRTALKIYNILGQEVVSLVDEPEESGYHTVTWDGKDYEGQDVSSGVYFYRLESGNFVETKRMVLMR